MEYITNSRGARVEKPLFPFIIDQMNEGLWKSVSDYAKYAKDEKTASDLSIFTDKKILDWDNWTQEEYDLYSKLMYTIIEIQESL